MDTLHAQLRATQPPSRGLKHMPARPLLSYDGLFASHGVADEDLEEWSKPFWDGQATVIADDAVRDEIVAAFSGVFSHEALVDLAKRSRLTRIGATFSPEMLASSAFGDDPVLNAGIAADGYAVLRFLLFDAPPPSLAQPDPRTVDALLAMCIDQLFYTRLAAAAGGFSVSAQPLPLQLFMHEASHRIAMGTLWEAASVWVRDRPKALASVLDALFLLARADFSAAPLMPEVRDAVLETYHGTAMRRSSALFMSNDEPDPPPLGESFSGRSDGAHVTVRQLMTYMGVAGNELASFAEAQPTWHAAVLFNAETARVRVVRTLSRAAVMESYGVDARTGALRHARATVVKAMQNLSTVVARTPLLTQNGVDQACVLAAVGEFVARRVRPIMAEFIESYGAAGDWERFSLDPDFLDNIATLGALFASDAWLEDGKREMVQRAMAADLVATAARRDPGVAHWYSGERKSPAAWKRRVDARLDAVFGAGDQVQLAAFLRDVVGISDTTLQRASDMLKFDSSPEWDELEVVEPRVLLHASGIALPTLRMRCFMLVDPQFYLCYLLLRVVYKDRGMLTRGLVSRELAACVMVEHMPAVVGFVYGPLARALAMTPTMARRAFPGAFRMTAGAKPASKDNPCRAMPRYTRANRVALCHLLIHQLELRAGRDDMPASVHGVFTKGSLASTSHWVDMDRLIAIYTGRAFAPGRIVPAVRAASVSISPPRQGAKWVASVDASSEKLEMHVRAAGIHASTPRAPVPLANEEYIGMADSDGATMLTVTVPPWARAHWLWMPSRDDLGRWLHVGEGPVLRVPHLDGLEGEYMCVVGTPESGYALLKRKVRLQRMCVRTRMLYEEATNARSAVWTWGGVRFTGWRAPTPEPYGFTLPDRELTVADIETHAGDVRADDAMLLAAFPKIELFVAAYYKSVLRLLLLLARRAHWPDTRPPLPGAATIPPPEISSGSDLILAIATVDIPPYLLHSYGRSPVTAPGKAAPLSPSSVTGDGGSEDEPTSPVVAVRASPPSSPVPAGLPSTPPPTPARTPTPAPARASTPAAARTPSPAPAPTPPPEFREPVEEMPANEDYAEEEEEESTGRSESPSLSLDTGYFKGLDTGTPAGQEPVSIFSSFFYAPSGPNPSITERADHVTAQALGSVSLGFKEKAEALSQNPKKAPRFASDVKFNGDTEKTVEGFIARLRELADAGTDEDRARIRAMIDSIRERYHVEYAWYLVYTFMRNLHAVPPGETAASLQTKVAAAIAEHALEKGKDKYAAKYMQSMVKYYVDRKNKPSQ